MRPLILTGIFISIIPLISCNQVQYQFDKDDPMNRFNRAAVTLKPNPLPPPQKGQTPSNNNGVPGKPATELVKRHMSLARVFNALYLYQKLADKLLSPYELVAGLWNLNDVAIIDKLVSLKIDGLSTSLKQLETAIKTVPDDLTVIADVGKMNQKLESVKGITDAQKQALVTASDVKTIPEFIRNQLIEHFTLQENFVKLASNELENVKNLIPASFSALKTVTLRNSLEKIRIPLQSLPGFLKQVEASTVTSLDAFVAGVEAADAVKTKSTDLQELHTELIQTEARLKSIETLKFSVNRNELSDLWSLLEQLHTPHSTMSIASAFISNQDLSKVKNDFSDKWVMNVLSNGSDLQVMQKGTQFLGTFGKSFSEVNKYRKDLWNLQHIISIKTLSKYNEEVEKLLNYSKQPDAIPDDCFILPDSTGTLSLKDAKELNGDLKVFLGAIPEIKKGLNAIPEVDQIDAEIDKYINSISKVKKKEEFETWLNATDDLEAYLKSLVDPFDKLIQDQKFVDSAKRLEGKTKEILSTNQYIANFKIAMRECDSVFTINPNNLAILNDIPKSIQNLKTDTPFAKLQPLLTIIPKVSDGLKKLELHLNTTKVTLKPTAPPSIPATTKPSVPSKPKRSIKEKDLDFVIDPQNLLDFAFSASCLQQMELIEQFDADIWTVVNAANQMKGFIQTVQDPEKNRKLTEIWKDSSSFAAKLSSIQANNRLAIAKLSEQKLEKNLQEVGYIYSNLTTLKPSERAEIRKYRESMVLLDPPHVDVEKAMERLEGPMATDWAMAHASFTKMPDALVDLQRDLAKFFGGDKKNDGGGGFGKFFEDNLIYLCIGFGLLVILIIVLIIVIYWFKHIRDPEMKQKLPDDERYTPTKLAYQKEYTYMQLQDSRNDRNKRNKETGNTSLFDAASTRNWLLLERLMRDGAILDATCNGKKNRTALFELVLMKETNWCEKFLEGGADPKIHDYIGEDAETWSNVNGMKELFDKHYDLREKKSFDLHRYLPEDPRPWKVLVYDEKCFPRKFRKRLPLRIKKNITYGYKPGMDLNSFTTIIVPPKYIKSEKSLLLTDDDVLPWKLYGCKAVLTNPNWLYRLVKEGRDNWKKIMNQDYENWIMHVFYKDDTHGNSVVKHKTAIHKMQTPKLANVRITLLETADKKIMEQQAGWKEVIEMFGGVVVKEPVADKKDEILPYDIRSPKELEITGDCQCCSWILKYKDSKIKKSWVLDWTQHACVDFSYLPMCLAFYQIQDRFTDKVPLATIEDISENLLIDDVKTPAGTKTKKPAKPVENEEKDKLTRKVWNRKTGKPPAPITTVSVEPAEVLAYREGRRESTD